MMQNRRQKMGDSLAPLTRMTARWVVLRTAPTMALQPGARQFVTTAIKKAILPENVRCRRRTVCCGEAVEEEAVAEDLEECSAGTATSGVITAAKTATSRGTAPRKATRSSMRSASAAERRGIGPETATNPGRRG